MPAAAPAAASPNPFPASVRPAAPVLEAAAGAVEELVVTPVGKVVGKVVGRVVGTVMLRELVIDESALCTTDESEDRIEESWEEAAVVSKERVLKGNPLELKVRNQYLGFHWVGERTGRGRHRHEEIHIQWDSAGQDDDGGCCCLCTGNKGKQKGRYEFHSYKDRSTRSCSFRFVDWVDRQT
jgi:hypothetical protein